MNRGVKVVKGIFRYLADGAQKGGDKSVRSGLQGDLHKNELLTLWERHRPLPFCFEERRSLWIKTNLAC